MKRFTSDSAQLSLFGGSEPRRRGKRAKRFERCSYLWMAGLPNDYPDRADDLAREYLCDYLPEVYMRRSAWLDGWCDEQDKY